MSRFDMLREKIIGYKSVQEVYQDDFINIYLINTSSKLQTFNPNDLVKSLGMLLWIF